MKEQGKLTEALEKSILACDTKSKLEDIYLPYKPKRRTRATIAKERGLGPLADLILQQPLEGSPEQAAALFVNLEKEVPDTEAALKGARDIVAEQISEKAEVRQLVRDALMNLQRRQARDPGLVGDGRDLGTIVFPDADLKIFLDANVEVRAERRYLELIQSGQTVERSAILRDLENRDYLPNSWGGKN